MSQEFDSWKAQLEKLLISMWHLNVVPYWFGEQLLTNYVGLTHISDAFVKMTGTFSISMLS